MLVEEGEGREVKSVLPALVSKNKSTNSCIVISISTRTVDSQLGNILDFRFQLLE